MKILLSHCQGTAAWLSDVTPCSHQCHFLEMTLLYLASIINAQEMCAAVLLSGGWCPASAEQHKTPSSLVTPCWSLGTGSVPGWELFWQGAGSWENCVCLNKNESPAKVLWYSWYETFTLGTPRPPQIFWFWPPFIQHVLSDQYYNRALYRMFCVVWTHIRILLSKPQHHQRPLSEGQLP